MRTAPGRKHLHWWTWLAQRLHLTPAPLGDRGEAHAAKYLRQQGMKIIAKNRTHRRGEIDLIALDKDFIVFVEVRTRTSEDFMSPEQSIRHWKRKTLIATIRRLMRKHKKSTLRPRIDLIAIIWPAHSKKPTTLRHHRAAIPLHPW